MAPGILELEIVILIALMLGFLSRVFKQPLILAYLFTGVVIGAFGVFNTGNREIFQLFSDLGIMFVLFLVGLDINYDSLKIVGKTALRVGLGQIVGTLILGFLLAQLLKYNFLEATYLAIALTFSSTVIVVELLSQKKNLNSLYGKICLGVLLVQDLIAILILMFLSSLQIQGLAAHQEIIMSLGLTAIKAGVVLAVTLWLGKKLLPGVLGLISGSQELLFLASLAWVFVLVVLVNYIGFPIEIGGFLAGLSLANSTEHLQIAGKVKSLRDFFLLIFFVLLGASVVLNNPAAVVVPIAILVVFVLLIKPLIVMVIMGRMGYRRRTGMLTGLALAQVSEFSLILVALGVKLGHIQNNILVTVTFVSIITITISSYFISYGEKIYRLISNKIRFFEQKNTIYETTAASVDLPIVLIGFHRLGRSLAINLPREKLLVIDFDPEMVEKLKNDHYEYLFGDIADEEVRLLANLDKAKLVISTSPNLADNLTLLDHFKKVRTKPKLIIRAENEQEARILYMRGVDYVLLPQLTSGYYVGEILGKDQSTKTIEKLKNKDRMVLRDFAEHA